MASFFDKVVVGLNKGVNTVSDGSKFIVEKANLNTQIEDMEREKNNLLQNLGSLVYNLHTNGKVKIEQCTGMCNELASINQRIKMLQQKLQVLEASKIQTALYSQAAPTQESSNIGVQCSCGYISKENAKFCAKCGQPLANITAVENKD